MTRREWLAGAAVTGGLLALPGLAAAEEQLRLGECLAGAGRGPGLKALAAESGRFFGCAVKDPLFTDQPFADLVVHDCDMLVCIYNMKWKQLEKQRGDIDFRRADLYVDFAEQHGLMIRGHTLVWDRGGPEYFPDDVSAKQVEADMGRFIETVMGHYAGRMHSWDVVNEAVWPKDGRPDRLRHSPFLSALGPDYIPLAFEMARAADPGTKLYYNANPAPYGRRHDRPHFEGVIELLAGLVARGTPIDGVGLQSHLSAARNEQFDEPTLAWFFEQAQALGLEIMITEFDVTDKELPPDIALRDRRVADATRQFLDVALAFPAVNGVVCWGLADRYTELNRWPRPDGWSVRGFPYDHCLQPKPMYFAIADSLSAAAGRRS